MAKPAGGWAVLAQAKAVLEGARSVEGLKMAQAAGVPWERGLTLRQIAAIGVSPGGVRRLRCRFERMVQRKESPKPPSRELLPPQQEAVFLAP